MAKPWTKKIAVPEGVRVDVQGNEIVVAGSKGKLFHSLPQALSIEFSNGTIMISRHGDSKSHRTFLGVTGTFIANMVRGVSEGFQKRLRVVGIGYQARLSEGKLILQIGYSHPVEFIPPPGISLSVEGNNIIVVSGIDKGLVGTTAAEIRRINPPDAYKGKGVRFVDEELHLKAGKVGKTKGKKKK